MSRPTRLNRTALALAAACACFAGSAQAASLLTGLGGDSGYGTLAMTPNDDESSSVLNLPFAINFFGNTYTTFFANNNGNITFESPLGDFTPNPFPVANQPMIAPWWADVDTRVAGSTGGGEGGGDEPAAVAAFSQVSAAVAAAAATSATANNVYVASPNASTLVVTWDQVGYYSRNTDLTNSFQLVLRDRSDTGKGNFDIDFRYEQLQWTTGDASEGTGGLAGATGTAAQAGYDAGNQSTFLTLPNSRTDAILNLATTSNVGADTPGLWTFAVRNGDTPGTDPSNPLMPVVVDGSFSFDFNVQANTRYFIDPVVAVGYDYVLTSSDAQQSFASVIASSNVGDGLYDLFLWDGAAYNDSGVNLAAGEEYTFGTGVTRFSLRGIEVSAAVDPTDTSAFVTGLTFSRAGDVNVSQTPLTFTTAVPEPETYALMLGGLAALGLVTRRRRQQQAQG